MSGRRGNSRQQHIEAQRDPADVCPSELLVWSELAEVVVRTTSHGPGAEDLFFVLRSARGVTVVVPHQETDRRFIDRLQSLPGFRAGELWRAMRSTEEAAFVCWRAHQPRHQTDRQAGARNDRAPTPNIDDQQGRF
jgi:hypothetical protein